MYKIPILLNIYRNQTRVKNLIDSLRHIEPQKIYLFQDGGINNDIIKDLDRNLEYAKSLITWPCSIETFRLEDDIGPAAAEYYAYKWMFSKEEMGIILEDDLVPNHSFFKYAEILLERYKDNNSISYIAGTNPYGVYKTDYDYFFSTRGSLYGFATWRRFIETLDLSYSWIDLPNLKELMLSRCCDKKSYDKIVKKSISLRKENKPDFEVLICMATVINGQFSIIPKFNLVQNRGVDLSSVNGAKSMFLLPKIDQKQFNAKTYDIKSFDKYPNQISEQPGYRKFYNSGIIKTSYRLVSITIRRVLYRLIQSFSPKND